MKNSAISKANQQTDITGSYYERCMALADSVSCAALAYILDPQNSGIYKNKVLGLIQYWKSGVDGNLFDEMYKEPGNNWMGVIPPAGAFVTTLVALDIVYPSLTQSEISTANGILEIVANNFEIDNAAMIGIWGARGTWALYTGDVQKALEASQAYKSCLIYDLTNDGVPHIGNGYAYARYASNEYAKMVLPDLMEHTGVDNSYYTNEKFISMHEWIQNSLSTPFGRMWIFGDTEYGILRNSKSVEFYQAFKYSNIAAANAVFNMKGVHTTSIFSFLLLNKRFPSPEVPKSRIYKDGGAWFYENYADPNSLAGVLWNCKSQDWHSHKEVNAINAVAYGEFMVSNSGYAGAGSGQGDYTWNYINNRAVSANTVLFNYDPVSETNPSSTNDHVSKVGNGLIEGFTTPYFDYAIGDSGAAMGSRKHYRNFVFVHPQDNANGYWVLFDSVEGLYTSDKANVVIRPYSADYQTATVNTEYTWNINSQMSNHPKLSVFLATQPTSVSVKNGMSVPKEIKYLFSSYSVNANKKKNIVTVLFPFDDTHSKATMSRISGTGYSGALINLGGNIIDYAIESSASGEITYNGVTINGKSTLYRKNNGLTGFYYLNDGTKFFDGSKGFDTTGTKISVFMKGNEGKVYTTTRTYITFRGYDISDVIVNGITLGDLIVRGNGWIRFYIDIGVNDIEFVS